MPLFLPRSKARAHRAHHERQETMSDRITVGDLERLIGRIDRYADTLGIIDHSRGERLGLDQGSATYGRAWRIFSTGLDGNTGHGDPFHLGSGYLGWSKAEAHLTLRGLEAGLWRSIVALETRNKARATQEKAEAMSHGKPASEMRTALLRLGEIVREIDLDQPITF